MGRDKRGKHTRRTLIFLPTLFFICLCTFSICESLCVYLNQRIFSNFKVYIDGLRSYLRDMWNFIDFTRNMLYLATGVLRLAAYLQQRTEIRMDPSAALISRENWGDFDPQLIAEGLFAAANVFSALKLVHLFSINPHLGPLQVSYLTKIFFFCICVDLLFFRILLHP